MSDHLTPVVLVGAGPMAIAYARVLDALERPFTTVGRGSASAAQFEADTGHRVHRGGFASLGHPVHTAIVATGVAELAAVTSGLIDAGASRILVEKPGALDHAELARLAARAAARGAQVYVAYNRRFYGATRIAQRLIAEDGGVTSFSFEFTEWSHEIVTLRTAAPIKAAWLLANSSHVLDLAFFLGGQPSALAAFAQGGTSWHPSGSVYAGAGRTDRGALFSYQANWEAPGRWGVEVQTKRRRFIFRPMEKLHVMTIGSVAITEHPLEDDLDSRFKPGIYRQLESFLGDAAGLPTLAEQVEHAALYERIGRGT